MKKFLLSIGILAVAVSVVGCSSKNKWSRDERRQMREELRNYRDMIYVQNLNDEEFDMFSDDVTDAIEIDYPVYTTFIEMPGSGDTVEVYVVSTIVNQLDADAHNMRNIYPYPYLVAQGVLPDGLSREAQHAFYKCFAGKVDNYYPSTQAFFQAIMADTTSYSQMARFQQQCAADLFDWTVVIDETIVTEE